MGQESLKENPVNCVKSRFAIDCHSGLDPESSISELDSRFRGNDGFGTNVKKRWTHDTIRGMLTAGIDGVDGTVSSGFTLVEVMVALTILGFIILMVSGTFRLALSSWEKGDSIKEDYQKVRMISQLLSRQMKSAVPYKFKTEKTEGDYLAFDGKTHSLRFVSALAMKAKRLEGFVYVVYQFKNEGEKKGRLVLYEQRALNRNFFEDDLKEDSALTLFDGVSQVRFEYYREANEEKNQREEWVEEWNAKDEKELPKALRMTVAFLTDKGKEEESPVTVLAPVAAYQFEELRTGLPGRQAILMGPQPRGY